MTNFTGFFYALFDANKWDISNLPRTNCLSQDTKYFFLSNLLTNLYPEQLFITGHQTFFSKKFIYKSLEEELILYKKHILAAKL